MLPFDLKELIIAVGYVGLFAIIFAESGLLIGFFLPGDSLLFTAGFLASQQLDGKPILIVSGKHDAIVPLANAQRLATILREGGADVKHHFLPAGHALTEQDIDAAKHWLRHYPVTLSLVKFAIRHARDNDRNTI